MYVDKLGILHDSKGRVLCARCRKNARVVSMSWFNTEMICERCQRAEQKDPRYQQAREAERQAVMQGNYNYKGIGYK